MDRKEIPYAIKPFIYELHKKYMDTKIPISWPIVKNYMYELEPKRIQFSLNRLSATTSSPTTS